MSFTRADLADLNKKAGITLPFRRVTTISREATFTDTGCTATVGVPTRVTCTKARSNVLLLSAVDVLVKQRSRRLRANLFSTFTRNIPQLTTKTTVPDTFLSTSKTLFLRP